MDANNLVQQFAATVVSYVDKFVLGPPLGVDRAQLLGPRDAELLFQRVGPRKKPRIAVSGRFHTRGATIPSGLDGHHFTVAIDRPQHAARRIDQMLPGYFADLDRVAASVAEHRQQQQRRRDIADKLAEQLPGAHVTHDGEYSSAIRVYGMPGNTAVNVRICDSLSCDVRIDGADIATARAVAAVLSTQHDYP